ncbi:MAG TPA: pre-peptidase C-terminal domain-containing protein, partial [Candidatus Thermoplasmatota archaeon]|nr:pre-peptidase C-terminal domain-containing protein [Candidatus Thermoplasmatota archaeon]
ANTAPAASFTHSASGLTLTVTSTSTDPDGDTLTASWAWGDGTAAGTGSTASHTYASGGTYTVTLTVSDGNGGSASASQQVTVTAPADPDPSTPNLDSGVPQSVTVSAGQEKFYKIQVPAGSSQLKVEMSGPSCGLLNCPLDADLYTRHNTKPTNSAYDCRPFLTGNAETCTHTGPAAGWWYVRVHGYSGSGTVGIKATVT